MSGLGRRTHYRKHVTDFVLYGLPTPQPDERVAKVVGTRGGNQFDVLVASNANDEEDVAHYDGDAHDGAVGGDDEKNVGRTTRRARREPQLAILPTKFRKLVWLKRNDYVLVRTGGDDDRDAAGDADGGDAAVANADDDGGGKDLDDRERRQQQRELLEEEEAQRGTDDDDMNIDDVVENDDDEKGGNGTGTGGDKGGDKGGSGGTGIRFIITHPLYKEQVKHLVSMGIWPTNDPEFRIETNSAVGGGDNSNHDGDDDGIVYSGQQPGGFDDYVYDDENDNFNDNGDEDAMFANPNRRRMALQDDDESSSSEEDE